MRRAARLRAEALRRASVCGVGKIILAPFLALTLLLFSPGCTRSSADRQAIEKVVLTRQQALTAKDIKLYLTVISPAYNDKGKDYATETRELETNFRTFERINYRSLDRKIEIDGQQAIVSGTYRITIVRKGQELSLEGSERIRLAKEADGWKIVGGL